MGSPFPDACLYTRLNILSRSCRLKRIGCKGLPCGGNDGNPELFLCASSALIASWVRRSPARTAAWQAIRLARSCNRSSPKSDVEGLLIAASLFADAPAQIHRLEACPVLAAEILQNDGKTSASARALRSRLKSLNVELTKTRKRRDAMTWF